MFSLRDAVLAALINAVDNGLPEKGPRGGKVWSPRFFARRVAWHTLDHAWEIEDRIVKNNFGGAKPDDSNLD